MSQTSLKFKTSALQQTISTELEDKSQTRRKIFAKDTSDKGLLYKIHKELLKLNNKKANDLIKKLAKDLNRNLS